MTRKFNLAVAVLLAALPAAIRDSHAATFKFEAKGFVVGATPACLPVGATFHLPLSGVFLASDAGEDQRWLLMSPTDSAQQFATVINASGAFTEVSANVTGTRVDMAGGQNYNAKAKMNAVPPIDGLVLFSRTSINIRTFLGQPGCNTTIHMLLSRLPG